MVIVTFFSLRPAPSNLIRHQISPRILRFLLSPSCRVCVADLLKTMGTTSMIVAALLIIYLLFVYAKSPFQDIYCTAS